MEKSVGGVDLEELMRARQELDQERGVETDPDMYNDYNKSREESSIEKPVEQVSEPEVLQDYSNNEETNDSMNYNNDLVQNETAYVSEEPVNHDTSEINQEGWVADDAGDDTIIGITQSVSDVVENEDFHETETAETSMPAEETTVAAEEPVAVSQPANEPKDLNMYDIFAQFEVAENAGPKSSPEPEVQSAPVTPVAEEKKVEEEDDDEIINPATLENAQPTFDSNEDNEESKTTGFEDLINELLAGYDLDALDDDELEDEPEESVNTPVETVSQEKFESVEDEDISNAINQTIASQELIGEEISSEAKQAAQEDVFAAFDKFAVEPASEVKAEEPKVEEQPAPEQPVQEVEVEEVQTSPAEELSSLEEFENSLKADIEKSEEQAVEESVEETTQETVEETAEEEPDIGKIVEEILPITKMNKPEPVVENETTQETPKAAAEETAETEVITDYSKLKDILQQELEEAERAEIEQIEEVKSQVIKIEKTYNAIEQFNFVEEIVNDEFKESDKLSYLIGKDEEGKCVYGNFKEQYNLAIFGKEEIYTNNLVNTILLSLSLKNAVNDVNFIILDANVNTTFDIYNKSSYIFFNRIAKTNKEILDTLIEASKELDDRYNKLASFGVKSIEQYNLQAGENGLETMPYVILVFNNYTKSSQATDNDKIVACLHRMLKYGRIAGIYSIVVATNPIEQDEINFNLPTRIAFRDVDDSVYTIGEAGAASLTDDMDVLYSNIMDDKIVHLKTPNISETEKELLISGLEE